MSLIIQLLEKSENSFIMKCIEVRQKDLLASKKWDIKYDNYLEVKLIYHTFERVVQDIKPLLRSSVFNGDLTVK